MIRFRLQSRRARIDAAVSGVHAHSKLITAAARDVLRPLGLVQKGRSRTWLDDRTWCLTVVEFQPSSWSRGSYLNVGVHWLWNPTQYLRFDYGNRVMDLDGDGQYVGYESDEQFGPLALKLAEIAAEQVRGYRDRFPDVVSAATVLADAEQGGRDGLVPTSDVLRWIDAGIALGVAGRTAASKAEFGRYLDWYESRNDPESHEVARCGRVRELEGLVSDTEAFRGRIHCDVEQGRVLLKLEPAELPF
jgi:hypothetical protein